MKRLLMTFVILILLAGIVAAQDNQLSNVAETIGLSIQQKMPGWKHKRGKPVTQSENVIIDYWYSRNQIVKISIIPYKSQDEAAKALAEFVSDAQATNRLQDLGDEGYSWGIGESKFAFRKGNLTIYVSTIVNDEDQPAMLSQDKKELLKRTEREAALSKQFAHHVSDVLQNN